jgi:SecD/SecF fusion protein
MSLLVVAALLGCGTSTKSTHGNALSAVKPGDMTHGTVLTYSVMAGAAGPVTTEAVGRAVQIIRERLSALGVEGSVQTQNGRVIVALPRSASSATPAQDEVGQTAQLYFYDWEPNVIGPQGSPQPAEATVTGGPAAGDAATGIPEYQAVERALRRPAILRRNDTTWHAGCTPRQLGGCIYGQWYLLSIKSEKVLRGPEDTAASLYAGGYRRPAGTAVRAVRVNPGTVLVRAEAETNEEGKVSNAEPESWYVLNDSPALSGSDIRNPTQSFESGGGSDGAPDVTFGFSPSGGAAFQRLTREIARRGQNEELPGVSPEAARQHFAVVLDDQIITTPSIDYTRYPDGINPSNGSEITGGFTAASARELADELQSGALPVRLELVSVSR